MEAETWVVLQQLGFAHVHLWRSQENTTLLVAPWFQGIDSSVEHTWT